MKNMRKMMKKQDGQGMDGVHHHRGPHRDRPIGVVTVFGDNIRKIFGASVNALANSSTSDTGAKKAGDSSNHRNITDFASKSTSQGA